MYGIYANIWGILMGSMLPYIAYMDTMGMAMLIFQGMPRLVFIDDLGVDSAPADPRRVDSWPVFSHEIHISRSTISYHFSIHLPSIHQNLDRHLNLSLP